MNPENQWTEEEMRQQGQMTQEQLEQTLRNRHLNMLGQMRNIAATLGPLLENIAVEITLDKEGSERQTAALKAKVAQLQKALDEALKPHDNPKPVEPAP